MKYFIIITICSVTVLSLLLLFASSLYLRGYEHGYEAAPNAGIYGQEVSAGCYCNLSMDIFLFPEVRPAVQDAMSDNKVTVGEMIEIYRNANWSPPVKEVPGKVTVIWENLYQGLFREELKEALKEGQ